MRRTKTTRTIELVIERHESFGARKFAKPTVYWCGSAAETLRSCLWRRLLWCLGRVSRKSLAALRQQKSILLKHAPRRLFVSPSAAEKCGASSKSSEIASSNHLEVDA